MQNSVFPVPDRLDTIIIGGPTASGKTALAINLAENIVQYWNKSCEIINADSVQMYHDLKTLTAYPSEEDLAQVPHHLFGILDPYESSSVASWLDLAHTTLNRLHCAGKIAIVCGGTGLYLRALTNGIAKIPKIPEHVRFEVRKYFDEVGRDIFFRKLAELDVDSAKKLHKNDTQRILRAYEVVTYTGKPLVEWWNDNCNNECISKERIASILLLPSKESLCQKAALRTKKMLSSGAIEEVRNFNEKYPEYGGPLIETIGYHEISEFLQHSSNQNIESLEEKICIKTNQYIKRQSTWFRNQLKDAKFISEFGDNPLVLQKVLDFLHNHDK